MRFRKIWKNIHPRRLKASLVIGTGSPDTTGYVLGLYGILSPHLGKHVNVEGDFENAVFRGDFFAVGRITIFQVLYHGLRVAMDGRLKELKEQIKEFGKQSDDNAQAAG